jgi:hypothetical protein
MSFTMLKIKRKKEEERTHMDPYADEIILRS